MILLKLKNQLLKNSILVIHNNNNRDINNLMKLPLIQD